MDEKHYFTDDEKSKLAKEMEFHALEIERLENEKKVMARDYKAQIDEAKERLIIVAQQHRDGFRRQIGDGDEE